MYRFLSWMAIGVAAAFLVVATAAFSLPVIKWLAFAIGFGTLIVSGSTGFSYRQHIPTVLTGLATALVSAWTVVASVVFSRTPVLSPQELAHHDPQKQLPAISST